MTLKQHRRKTNTRKIQKVAQRFVLSAPAPQSVNGGTGKSSMAKCDMGSICTAADKNMARKTNIMASEITADTTELRRAEETAPVE